MIETLHKLTILTILIFLISSLLALRLDLTVIIIIGALLLLLLIVDRSEAGQQDLEAPNHGGRYEADNHDD
jgi:hypothetical protein